VTISLNLGILTINKGEETTGHAHLDKSIAYARTYAMTEPLIMALIAKADAYTRYDLWQEAAECIQEAQTIAPDMLTPRQQAEIHRSLALIALAQGAYPQAQEHAQQAITFSAQGEDEEIETGMSYRVLAQVLAAAGQLDQACQHFAQSLTHLDEVPYEAARTHMEWGRMEQSRHNATIATTHLTQAREIFQELGVQRDLALVATEENHILECNVTL
jgi:tetratricopeptide (TPR) repeat protein